MRYCWHNSRGHTFRGKRKCVNYKESKELVLLLSHVEYYLKYFHKFRSCSFYIVYIDNVSNVHFTLFILTMWFLMHTNEYLGSLVRFIRNFSKKITYPWYTYTAYAYQGVRNVNFLKKCCVGNKWMIRLIIFHWQKLLTSSYSQPKFYFQIYEVVWGS